MTRILKASFAALIILNGVLLIGVTEAKAAAFVLQKTCSVHVATGECRCYHTIIPECDPDQDVGAQCSVQCALQQ